MAQVKTTLRSFPQKGVLTERIGDGGGCPDQLIEKMSD
jgi:hypothetical protein